MRRAGLRAGADLLLPFAAPVPPAKGYSACPPSRGSSFCACWPPRSPASIFISPTVPARIAGSSWKPGRAAMCCARAPVIPPPKRPGFSATKRRMLRFLAGLRCIPMGVNKPLHGASIHYAGTLPYSAEERPYTTSPDGKLHGAPNVYVADGASWRFMPAKGPHADADGQCAPRGRPGAAGSGGGRSVVLMSSAGQTVLITGATGFLGRAACAAFTAAGFQVRALVRNPAAAADLQPVAQGGIFRCDLPDVIDERALDGGARALIHCGLRDALGVRGTGPAHQREGNRSPGPAGPRKRRPAARVCIFHGGS